MTKPWRPRRLAPRADAPELTVLLAYAKMSLDQDLLASDLPTCPSSPPICATIFRRHCASVSQRKSPPIR